MLCAAYAEAASAVSPHRVAYDTAVPRWIRAPGPGQGLSDRGEPRIGGHLIRLFLLGGSELEEFRNALGVLVTPCWRPSW